MERNQGLVPCSGGVPEESRREATDDNAAQLHQRPGQLGEGRTTGRSPRATSLWGGAGCVLWQAF